MNAHFPQRLSAQFTARTQAGFTLVELVTVILILGVLAAVALPRYADLQGKAREAKVKAVAGSMKSAVGLVKASAMAGGVSCGAATGSNVTMEGLKVALNHCYPEPTGSFTEGILGAANVSSTDGWKIDGGGSKPGEKVILQLGDASTPEKCSITYVSAADANTPPSIETTLDGC